MMIDTRKYFNEWVAFALSDRFDREDFFSLAFRASDSTGVMRIGFVTKMIMGCLE